ncbi:aldehyde dehydrogenase [Labilithrix luteola]|uniref:Aldehyde dehydrogenase n=1 Tax=Labilithrix luteola TaxID=1391654 RepID=A0A0K1PXA3_9BACT|nr:aldehyde dehydrogenase family protein [Labilithrix luteola]AKU98016.1 aldehyde dehydrogenase [Labilithrix luteola]
MAQARSSVPEAFDGGGRVLSAVGNAWRVPPRWFHTISPIDGTPLAELPSLDLNHATEAVDVAASERTAWASRRSNEREALIARGVAALSRHRDLLVRLLAWEIGKTIPTASNDVDRCIASITWYLENAGPMLEGRRPLGLVSNLASWNYPFSVLLANMLVQMLAGNAVIAKIPTLGGGLSLSVAVALLRREGLPVTLVGGRGPDLTEALVGHPAIAAVGFVGGRTNGAAVAERLRTSGKRYALEMEGVNAYAVTEFSDWKGLEKQIRAGFDYGKQRCTAYTRWVVEASLLPRFIETYVTAASSLRVGHPFLGNPIDYGPLISSAKVEELWGRIDTAIQYGATVLYEGTSFDEDFEPGQDRSAYFMPVLLTGVRASADLYGREPFGPVDVLVAAHSESELVREANVSNGALVASVATDDPNYGAKIASRLDAFKVGVNRLRSRGDKDEVFGGTGKSWAGAFVGGSNVVYAFTDGERPPPGNWPGGWRGPGR